MTRRESAEAVLELAWKARCAGRLDEAAARYEELLAGELASFAPALQRRALSGRAQVHRDRGETQDAVRVLDEAVRCAREVGEEDGLAHALRHAAEARIELAVPATDEAVALSREALDLLRARGADGLPLANAWRVVALAHQSAGDVSAATAAWREAEALYRSAGVEAGVEEARDALERLEAG